MLLAKGTSTTLAHFSFILFSVVVGSQSYDIACFAHLPAVMLLQDCFLSLNPKPVPSNDNRKRYLILLLLLLSGNVEPNPGPDFVDMCTSKGLHIIHLNVRSLVHKISQIRDLVQSSKAGIVGITETWLDSSISDAEIELENYSVIRKDRNRNGGGVCMFIRSDVVFSLRTDLSDDYIEAIWADILLPKCKPFLVGTCYRPPEQNDFYSRVDEICSKHNEFLSGEVLLLGDLNTDVSNHDHYMYKAFHDFCTNFNFKQLINKPTRITSTSQTTIDFVLVSDKSKISNSGVIDCGISGHSIIFCTRKVHRASLGHHNSVKIRSLKNYNSEVLKERLMCMNWSQVFNCVSVDKAWGLFKSLFLKVVDDIAPVKTTRFKVRSEPWMNSEILKTIKSRDETFKKFRENREENLFREYKSIRNEVTRLIRHAKTEYFNDKITENKTNPQQLWKCLKQTDYSNRLKTKARNMNLNINGELITGNVSVANSLNQFFSTVANTLVNKLPSPSGIFGESHVIKFYNQKGAQADAFSFTNVSEDVVLKKLKALNLNKATGQDNISAKFLQDAAEAIAPCLTFIFNKSLEQGHFPTDFKVARVVALYKKGNKLD